MMKYLVTGFAKITGVIPMYVYYRPRIFYSSNESRKAVGKIRKIKQKAIIISNHTSVYDCVFMWMLFPFRFVRIQMAEILFKHNWLLSWFLRNMGGIYVDRNSKNLSFMSETLSILKNGGCVGIFPEARISKTDEKLPFSLSTISIALKSGAPIIPLYMSPRHKWKRAGVFVGEPIYLNDFCIDSDPSVEKLKELAEYVQGVVKNLKVQYQVKMANKKTENSNKQTEFEREYNSIY